MENRKTYKDLVVGEKTYRLAKMDARSACWLFSFLAFRASEGEGILASLGKCSREDFSEIQSMSLGVVTHLDTKDGETFPTPILAPNGSVADPSLADHAGNLFKLTTESIMFNLTPFLPDNGSKAQ